MSMTLEEAIAKCEEWIEIFIESMNACDLDDPVEKLLARNDAKGADEQRQLAEWLRELQERRKQPEVIHCGKCRHYKPMSNHWGKCGVHSSPAEKYRTCQICDYCSWSERRTDERFDKQTGGD